VSGVVAEKTGAAQALYNRASGLVSAMVAAWREATGGDEVYLASILSRGPEAVERLRRILAGVSAGPFTGAELTRRLEHFLAENGEIVGPAGDALAAGDLDGFGRVVDRSQALTESLLGNQVPETVALARTARECGALAASAFGAGFGGSVWALVCADRTETFLARWSAAYRAAHPEAASRGGFFTTRAGPAAFDLSH
jgi:galactokinase